MSSAIDTEHLGETDLKDVQKAEIFLADAQAGNESERKMGLMEALKLYPRASAWSILISFAVVMEGELSCRPPAYQRA